MSRQVGEHFEAVLSEAAAVKQQGPVRVVDVNVIFDDIKQARTSSGPIYRMNLMARAAPSILSIYIHFYMICRLSAVLIWPV